MRVDAGVVLESTLMTWGWSLVLAGFASGALIGLGFHREAFFGGYGSWRRRLLRLGHVACVALGALQMLAALSPAGGASGALADACSVLWRTGAVAMPVVCFLSAWRPSFRHLFFVPVLSLAGAAACTLALIQKGTS